MDWANENWIKMYTRDTADLISIGWEGRAIWWEIMRKLDRSGVLDVPDNDHVVLADMLRIPLEVFEVGFPKIIKRGMAALAGGRLVVKNFMPAQEARSSDAQRQRDSRSKRRAAALGQLEIPAAATQVPPLQPPITPEVSQNVTESHQRSPDVTIRVDQTRSEEIRSLAHSVSDSDLEAVYQLYPRKQGKAAGLKAIRKLLRDETDFQVFRAAVERMALAWTGHNTDFCPHFSTFVRQERWRDESLPLPGSDRWTRPVNHGHSPAPARERFDDASEDDLGDADFGGLQ